MNDLEQAIQISGGVGALAKDLGVPNPNAISMWRKRGRVPLPWMKLIESRVLKKATSADAAEKTKHNETASA